MTIRTKFAAIGIAAGMVLAGAAPALAVAGYATSDLNMRSCGSTDCRVVDVLQRGEEVEIRFCEGVWCSVEARGGSGWVNANYLARAGSGDADDGRYDGRDRYDSYDSYDYDYYEPRRVYPRRLYRRGPDITACIGGRNARFCVYD